MMYLVVATRYRTVLMSKDYIVGIATTTKRAREMARIEEHVHLVETRIVRVLPNDLTETEILWELVKHGKLPSGVLQRRSDQFVPPYLAATPDTQEVTASTGDSLSKQNMEKDTKPL